jgi:YD repeat-containing protein
MKKQFKNVALALALGLTMFNCSTEDVIQTPALSTNPDDCKLSKIFYGSQNSSFYDEYSYNSEGKVESVTSNDGSSSPLKMTFTYQSGLLISQKSNTGSETKYTYNGSDLSKVQLLDKAGKSIGDLIVGLDTEKRIKTLTVKNASPDFAIYEGIISNFTYDATGNCTLIELKLGSFIVAKTEYSNFINVRSHYTAMKGLVFDPFNGPTEYLQNAPVWKFGPASSALNIKGTSFIDGAGKPLATPSVNTDVELKRTGNESGLMIQRTTIKPAGTSPIFYEYKGCK